MITKNIFIKKSEGIKFANLSGDKNDIHINDKVGYESQFSENIVHGALILIKVFKILDIKDYKSIKIKFIDFIRYNSKLKIIIKDNKTSKQKILIHQNNQIKITIDASNTCALRASFPNKITNKKKFKITKKDFKKFMDNKIDPNLKTALCYLSKYVGMFYPGKLSLINSINIQKNKSFKKNNYINIKSSQFDKRFPYIKNMMEFQNYTIDFDTSIRPVLRSNLKLPNKKIIKKIKKIKNNILIIGSSSGIGYDLMKLFSINKKIEIIATFNNNKIIENYSNLKKKKIDVLKKTRDIFKIIEKFNPLNIYYFATPHINNKINSQNNLDLYKKFYIKIPIKIINYSNRYKCNFFYPSTKFITDKDKSDYSKFKFIFEKKISTLSKKLNINILRIPKINTKQNLNLFNEDLPNFRDILYKDKIFQKSIFFEN